MGIEQRPYIGTWRLNNKKLVQHTPDAMVFINGDTSIPGCAKCGGRIDIQRFITQVTADAGTDPGAASANFTLAIPRHHTDTLIRDTQFILKPGLEVHVYMKGYFAVKGMYSSLTIQKPGKKKGTSQSVLQDIGSGDPNFNFKLDDMINYPFYHVFHGVVTQVDHAYSGGYWNGTITCAGMLHFWSYHNMSTNASLFGARPNNSKLRMSLVGNNFTRMTPYEIAYTLYHDTAGAAGGVGFAMGSKTNQNAKAPVGGESMFSLAIKYWQQRFDQGMNQLRMYGASGVLFSTAQAAFLGRLSTSQVTQVLKGRFPAKSNKTKLMAINSAATSLGLFNPRYRDALVYSEKTRGKRGATYDLSIAQMQAFITDISAFGQINMFESSYETKMNLMQAVCQVTGYEFYQDVDGDFVFKPPMYNMDTSSSRIYRIEDIDIISINFSSKEPIATYVTAKGSSARNIKGLGLENEWGVKGQYIDYRLVAQFGWRPGQFETSYLNDPRAMFFASINRLDLMNVDINYGSVTIPIRPEIRPGYPVYIPSMDCFYYLKQVQHAFQFGSQCTTSLQLVGRRAKFFPPGQPDKKGLDSIQLDNLLLPPKPLEVAGEDGVPRLAGFPNVVMALDPTQINPLFFVVGSDIEDISDPSTLENLVKAAALNYQALSLTKIDSSGSTVYSIPLTIGKSAQIYEFSFDDKIKKPTNSKAKFIDIKAASRQYTQAQRAQVRKVTGFNKKIGKAQKALTRARNRRYRLSGRAKQTARMIKSIARIDKDIVRLRNQIDTFSKQAKAASKLKSDKTKSEGYQVLVQLIRVIGDQYMTKNKSYLNMNSTANLLDMLSDKKAVVTNGQLPGSYRYYSASHPDSKHQGQPQMSFSDSTAPKIKSAKQAITRTKRPVQMFVKKPTAKYANGVTPEAELKTGTPTVGIKILTNDPKNPEKVVATSEITTLAFSTHRLTKIVNVTTFKLGEGPFKGLPADLQRVVVGIFKKNTDPKGTGTPDASYSTTYNKLSSWGRGFTGPTAPTKLVIDGFPISTKDKWSSIWALLKARNATKFKTLQDTAKWVADAYGKNWFAASNKQVRAQYNVAISKFKSVEKKVAASKTRSSKNKSVANKAIWKFQRLLSRIYNRVKGFAKKTRLKKGQSFKGATIPVEQKKNIESPIFPVSDARGYEVVGAYRYGRDVSIEPNGVFDQLLKQDPTGLLDRSTIEEFVDTLLGRRPVIAQETKVINGKTVATKGQPIKGEYRIKAARKQFEQKIKAAIKKRYSDQDQIDMGFAVMGEDNQLVYQLSNFYSTGHDGIKKVPVANAAFSLADLQKHVQKNICSCKAAEAELLIEAFGQDKFVMVSGTAEVSDKAGGLDKLTEWMANQITMQEPQWRVHQNALRGQVLDRRGKGLVDAFRDQIARISAQSVNNKANLDAIQAAGDRLIAESKTIGG